MTSRPPKWDWPSHLPRMIELYNTQMSIPDIYKAIQCDGFEPCQRSVYAKFKSLGYPTDPVGRNKMLEAQSPSAPSNSSAGVATPTTYLPPPNFHIANNSQSQLYTLPEDDIMEDFNAFDHTKPVGQDTGVSHDAGRVLTDHQTQNSKAVEHSISWEDSCESVFQQQDHTSDFSNWVSSNNAVNNFSKTSFESTFDFESAALDIEGAEYFGIDMGVHLNPPQDYDQSAFGQDFSGWNMTSPFAPPSNVHDTSMMEVDEAVLPSHQESADPSPQRTSSFRKGSIDIKAPFQGLLSHSGSTGTRNRLRSLFRRNSSTSVRSNSSLKKYAMSQFTSNTKDSGYSSGLGSCLSLDQSRRIKEQSLKEFNGLYRVACEHLHEPRGKAQCKDIPSCALCLYSSIHNLGWSARYLKFEVFLSELLLTDVYNITARDAAGNTALHYAAAGGASFRHLNALITAGVDPYAANSAGELFIYCLRPIEPFTLEPNMDCLNSEDLVHLLELVQMDRIKDWRDNEGQTVLHALYSKIVEPQLRLQVLDMFVNAGYMPSIRDRHGRIAEDVVPLKYDCHGQVIDNDASISSRRTSNDIQESKAETTPEDVLIAEWRTQQLSHIKAQSIIVEARRDVTYVDPKTRENVFHALSRLKNNNDTLLDPDHLNRQSKSPQSKEGNNIINNIKHFVASGADLNAHDRKGCHPLKAFICNRPPQDSETGATLSKYLDALLWKDSDARLPCSINVNLKDRDGLTALHCAAVRGRPDSVRSLIEAGANVNALTDDGASVLQVTQNAISKATSRGDGILVHLMKEVVSYLEHAGAVMEPDSLQERALRRQ